MIKQFILQGLAKYLITNGIIPGSFFGEIKLTINREGDIVDIILTQRQILEKV